MVNYLLNASLSLAKAEFKLKNEGTYLGILWYLLNPILLFLLLLLVFSDRLGQNIPLYPAYLLIGILIFNFFSSVTSESSTIILSNNSLIKSINFPKIALPLSVLFKYLYSHFFEIVMLALVLLILGIPIQGLILYPFPLLLISIFTFGLSLFLSGLTVYFIDLGNVWAFLSRLLWFATPIFYEIGGQTKLFVVNLLNPMYYFITLTRDLVVYTKMPELWVILGSIFYAGIALLVGLVVFNKLQKRFAELV